MKSKIKSGIKIYTFLFIYILLCCFIYSFCLINNKITESLIIEIIIGSSTFLLLGTLYSNSVHKKGLLIGSLVGTVHYLLIRVICFLAGHPFNFNIFLFLIYTISSTIGGILGLLFKKIF